MKLDRFRNRNLESMKETYKDLLPFYVLVFFIFILPFNSFLTVPIVIIFSIITVKLGKKAIWKYNFKNFRYFYLPMLLFYLHHVIGMLWSSNLEEGFKDLVQKLPFVIFPLLIPFLSLNPKRIETIFKFFTIANVIVVVINLINTLWRLHIYELPQHYKAFGTYHSIFTHRSYYALYLSVSLIYLFYKMEDYVRFNNKEYFLLGGITFFVLVGGIFLSLSKVGIIILLVLLILFAFKFFKSLTISKKVIFILGVLLLLFSSGKMILSRFSDIHFAFTEPYELEKKRDFSSSQLRLMIWESSISTIKEKPYLGYGTGTVKDILRLKNLEKNFDPLSVHKKKTNAHNQFLESFISLGITGFILALFIFINPLIISLKNKHFFQGLILIVFLINTIPESIFERQSGVIFITLFISLMPYFRDKEQKLLV